MQLVRQIEMKRSSPFDELTFHESCQILQEMQKGVPKSVWIGDIGCLNHPAVLKI